MVAAVEFTAPAGKGFEQATAGRNALSEAGKMLARELFSRVGKVWTREQSGVKRIAEKQVDLEVDGRPVRIRNDQVIVNAGGELPTEFLEKVGVKMRRYHGEAPGSRPEATRSHPLPSEVRSRRRARRLGVLFALLGAAVLASLAWEGRDYYLLSPLQRLQEAG